MKKIQKEIKEAKGKFFKRLSKTIFDERVKSYHLITLKQRHLRLGRAFEDSFRIEGKKGEIFDYQGLNEVLAIFRVLEKHYNLDIEYYDHLDIVDFCLTVRKKLIKAFWTMAKEKLGSKGFVEYHLDKESAYRELVFRGFMPNMLLQPSKNKKKDFYIISHTFGIIHPVTINTQPEAYEYQKYLGIMGHVGYNDPNRKN